jgi:hypothetical protein
LPLGARKPSRRRWAAVQAGHPEDGERTSDVKQSDPEKGFPMFLRPLVQSRRVGEPRTSGSPRYTDEDQCSLPPHR